MFSLTLFNLQGTRRSCGANCILAQLFAVVKNFFHFFCPAFCPVPRDSFDRIPSFPRNVNPFFQISFLFLKFLLKSRRSLFIRGDSPQLFSSKLAPHWRQVTLIFPFPRGTRSFTPQEGHLKILYWRRWSILARQRPLNRSPWVIARNRWFS